MSKKVILCVDDEKMVLSSLKAQLKRGLGPEYIIETAESGEDALEIIDEIETEGAELPLVISDQIMPGCKGDDLLIIINKRMPQAKSIMLTGHATAEAIGRALNYGKLYRYISKPWEEVDLILTVSEAVRSYDQAKTIGEQSVELKRLLGQLKDYNETLEQKVKKRTWEIEQKNNQIKIQHDALVEINAVKDRLFAIIGHDLRNSLSALISISQVLNRQYHQMNEDEIMESIAKIEMAVLEMAKLLEHLLEWAQFRNGHTRYSPYKFNLSSLATETISIMKTMADKKSIFIKQNIPDGVHINADRNMIATILRNLISNAIKFSPAGGIVEIAGSADKHSDGNAMYTIAVEDKGVGMNKEQVENLFNLARATSSAGTANERGIGLGLLICKDMIEMHGGSINALSSPGEGSKISFTIPLS